MKKAAFSRIRASATAPDGDAFLGDLVDFHTERPAVTEATLGALRTSDGRTGYDVLIDGVPDGARDVVELGCGNGPLLDRLLSTRGDLRSVIGVDACGPELELARKRSSDPRLSLSCTAAQQLAIPDATIDAVLSHHAFYLFVPLEPVIAEIARVLRPRGIFSFVTTSLRESDPASTLSRLYDRLNAHTRAEVPNFRGWGDRRVWSKAGLEELFFRSEAPFVAPLDVHEFVVSIAEPPDALCDRLMRFFYSAQLHDGEAGARLRSEWIEVLSSTVGEHGDAHFDVPSARVTVARR
jgi:SAM-dependent methyltransferase